MTIDEAAGAESETNCSDLKVDIRAKSKSNPLYVADSVLGDSDGFGLGAALISDFLANYQGDDDNGNNSVADETQLRLLVDCSRSAFLHPGSNTHQASNLQIDTGIIQ